MTITFDDFIMILSEFARAFDPAAEVTSRLLAEINFPPSRLPKAQDAESFWLNIAQMLRNGVLPSEYPFRELLTRALTVFPGNPAIRRLLDSQSLPASYPTTSKALPHSVDAQAASTTADTVQLPAAAVLVRGASDVTSLLTAAAQVAQKMRPPLMAEPLLSCAGTLYIHLPGADLLRANQFSAWLYAEMQRYGISLTASVAEFRECSFSRLFVEGPDQARFELGDVPASTTAKDVVRGVMNEYDPKVWGKDEQGRARPAVVVHVRADGTLSRIDANATLQDCGVKEGDLLRVHCETPDIPCDFQFGHVQASTSDKRTMYFFRELEDWSKGKQGWQKPAVVDHVREDGTVPRLAPDATLHDCGVKDGDILRVHPEAQAEMPCEISPAVLAIAWSPTLLTEGEYGDLVNALGNLIRASDGAGLRRLSDERYGAAVEKVRQ